MLKLAGYADRLSARPGETITFHVANATGEEVSASIVRVISADPNPAGPGIRLEPLAATLSELARPKPEAVRRGSFARIAAPGFRWPVALTMSATVMPTRLDGRRQTVMSLESGDGAHRLTLAVSADARAEAVLEHSGREPVVVCAATRIAEGRWHDVWLTLDGGRLFVRGLERVPGRRGDDGETSVKIGGGRPGATGASLTIAAGIDGGAAFCGRIEAPKLIDEGDFADKPATIQAHWDFARDIPTSRIVDVGPHGWHGTLINAPTRAVTGSNWSGREMCWRHAPQEYGAIHFHDDDIDDCRWTATHAWRLPDDLASGQYALLLAAGGEAENIPFFVAAPKGRPAARLAVLVSTFTYTIYGNHARPEWQADPTWQAAWRSQAAEWRGYPHNPGDHGDYGLSTYNEHTDGSGIAIASWHRPMLNLRVGYVTYPYPEIRGSGLRHYPADSHLTAWLEHEGIAYDIITDWELHQEGIELLAGYGAVVTGSHPEYHTREMLDALEAYKDGGGRFMYLGGNGFYWKIALSRERDGVIEIRRGEGGIRAWAAEPGEYYNQFDGEYGGLWRRNGRPPQHLTGVGFTAQGNFVGAPYHVRPEARASRAAWILNGVEGDTFGAHGLSGHGAAGFELDRADKRLGTPQHAVILASSKDHPPEAPWILVPEERLTHIVTLPGRPERELIRADLVFFETAGGAGAVFSTGSITWCGSLPTANFDNDVARITGNVVRRFLDPAPFPGAGV